MCRPPCAGRWTEYARILRGMQRPCRGSGGVVDSAGMRRPSARTAFLVATALALGLPLLGWLGLRGLVGAHGFDTPDVVPPPPTPANLASGRFQRDAAEHFEHVFFGRTELLFLKNGLFDVASAGQYHSGFAGHVIQGKDGWLFEKPYLDAAFRTNLPICGRRIRSRTRSALANLHRAFEKTRPGAPVAFILAPSKAEVLRDKVPDRFFAFGERSAEDEADSEPYRTVRDLLARAGFAVADFSRLAAAETDPRALFPYGGTHWTVSLAASAASNALALADPSLPRPTPLPPVFAPGPDDPRDRDLAHLLNIPFPYRRRDDLHAHASFPPPPVNAPGPERIYIIGDSFGEQLREALVRSGLYASTNIVLRFNELPSPREFRDAVSSSAAILFVYSAPSLASSRLAETAEALSNVLLPVVKPGRRYSLGRSPYAMGGAWREEDGGRVLVLDPGAEGFVDLPFTGGRGMYAFLWLKLLDPAGAVVRSVALAIPAREEKGDFLRVPVRASADAPLRVSSFFLDGKP